MFSTLDSKAHTERKRMLSHIYSNSYIQNSPDLNKILDITASNLREELLHHASKDAPIDIYKLTKAYGMDVTTANAFGLNNGTNFVPASRTSNPLEIFEHSLTPEYVFLKTELPPRLAGWICKIVEMLFPPRVSTGAAQSVDDLCREMGQKAKLEMQAMMEKSDSFDAKEKGGDGDMRFASTSVYTHLRSKLQESGKVPAEKLDNVAAAEMLDHMFAGNEGIGIALSYLTWELSSHPKIQRRLHEEVKNSLAQASVDRRGMLLPPAQALNALPILDAVLQETMRLYPSANGPFPRMAPAKGAQFGGVNVPSGTVASSLAYSLHRNPDVFPDPARWRAERWIGIGEEERREMMRWFWVFGSGGRMCIGNHLAVRMMKACVAAIYADFESNLVSGEVMPPQAVGLMGIPEGNRMVLKFRQVA